MKVGTIFQNFAPRNHAWFQVIICRTRTVVNNLGGTHAGSRFKVIGSYALSTIEYVFLPPYLLVNRSPCVSRSCPGLENLSNNSPKVTIFFPIFYLSSFHFCLYSFSSLRLTLAFYIFLQEHVFSVIDSISKLTNPVA